MRRNLRLLIVLILLAVLTSCSSSYYLYTSPEAKNDVFIDRGNEYQVAGSKGDNLTFMAAGLDTDNGDNRIIFAILNDSSSSYSFRDSQISIYGGNAERNEWTYIQKWSAAAFYDKTKRQAEAEQRAAAIAGALSVASAAMGSTSRSTVSTPYGTAVVTTRSYSASDVALTAMAASIYNRNLAQANKANLNYLKENLLYSSNISAGETYSGIIYFPGDRKYADYKIVFEDSAGKEDFIFTKSIREEILHPWTTDTSRDLNAITLNFSPFSDRLGVYYYWLPPKGVGLYTGVSYYGYKTKEYDTVDGYYWSYQGSGANGNFSFNFDPDPTNSSYSWKGRFTEKEYYAKAIAWPFGMTIKIANHSWLLVGATLTVSFEEYYIGKLEYLADGSYKLYGNNVVVKDSGRPTLEAQLGANFVFNYIDVGVIANYDFMLKRFAVDICAGVAL